MHAVTHASLYMHADGLDTEQLAEVATAGHALDCDSVLQEVERQHPGLMGPLHLIAKGLPFAFLNLSCCTLNSDVMHCSPSTFHIPFHLRYLHTTQGYPICTHMSLYFLHNGVPSFIPVLAYQAVIMYKCI